MEILPSNTFDIFRDMALAVLSSNILVLIGILAFAGGIGYVSARLNDAGKGWQADYDGQGNRLDDFWGRKY